LTKPTLGWQKKLGIKLAPRDDPDKAFGPRKTGTVFGIEYDTENWTWALPNEKLARIAAQIRDMLGKEAATQEEIQSIIGKIIHIKPLIPGAKFNMNYLMELNNVSMDGAVLVQLNSHFKKQLHFWYILLCTHSKNASIPAPEAQLPAWAIQCYTDAAGGSLNGIGKGVGIVIPHQRWWSYMPWSKDINSGYWKSDGKKVSRKLAALELIGPLITVSAGAKLIARKPLKCWVDNQGSCSIWRTGYSNSCKLSTTIVKAIATVADALGTKIEIQKITRCSNPGAKMADALSQADFNRFRVEGGALLNPEPAPIPPVLLKWCANPVVDDDLGKKIVTYIAGNMEILGYS